MKLVFGLTTEEDIKMKTTVYEIVNQKILESLERGVPAWRVPWNVREKGMTRNGQ